MPVAQSNGVVEIGVQTMAVILKNREFVYPVNDLCCPPSKISNKTPSLSLRGRGSDS